MLYPIMNSYRDVYSLDGIWQMKAVPNDYVPTAPATGTIDIAVPASMNEQIGDVALRDHVGKVLFERTFSMPIREDKKYRIRFSALSHKGDIYLNGELIASAVSGYLPVDAEITLQENNRLSVVIDNRLTYETMPVSVYDPETNKQTINFDFYNFTGIHRNVMVYTVPEQWIEDITVETFVDDCAEKVKVSVAGVENAKVDIIDADGVCVVKGAAAGEVITIKDPKLWNVGKAYLYNARVYTDADEYTLHFGIRKVTWDKKSFYVNGEKVYFKGYGRHEDFFISGKGTNLPLLVRDYNLMVWNNANSFRTSHYPYGEEVYDMADKLGFLIVDEVQAVAVNWADDLFHPDRVSDKTLAVHKECIRQMMARDKNHPSVVMVSIANEPDSWSKGAREYYKAVIDYTRTLTDLPLTLALYCQKPEDDVVFDMLDIISLNRYYGWYMYRASGGADHGELWDVERSMREEMQRWYDKYQMPILVTEFGADTLEGNHSWPAETFSEEYQVEIIDGFCKAFDALDFCIGEQVWNFADFKTKQGLMRPRGNRKGVFTKDRQPKMAAHYLRQRWAKK